MKMKKLMMMALMMCFTMVSFGQNKNLSKSIDINGIGFLKLGMSVDSVIIEEINMWRLYWYKNTEGTTYKPQMSDSLIFSLLIKDRLSCEIISDTSFNAIIHWSTLDINGLFHYFGEGSLDKRVRCFHIDEIKLAETIIVHDIYLRFFDNKLYKIDINESLNEILTIKYGTPTTIVKKSNSKGYKVIETYYTWLTTNDNIIMVTNFLSVYPNGDQCSNKKTTSLYNKEIYNNVTFQEKNILDKAKKQLDANKRKDANKL